MIGKTKWLRLIQAHAMDIRLRKRQQQRVLDTLKLPNMHRNWVS